MGLRIDAHNFRLPDGSVYTGDPASPEREQLRVYSDPVVLVEVLPPSGLAEHRRYKLDEYREIASLDTIVLIDPEAERCRVIQRLGPTSWRDDMFPDPQDVALPALDLTLPHDEIFSRD